MTSRHPKHYPDFPRHPPDTFQTHSRHTLDIVFYPIEGSRQEYIMLVSLGAQKWDNAKLLGVQGGGGQNKRDLELFWTRSMKERMRNGSDEKRDLGAGAKEELKA